MFRFTTVVAAAIVIGLTSHSSASVITDGDIQPTSAGMVASGNGTLDLILFGSAGGGGVTGNDTSGFNGDDAMQTSILTQLIQGGIPVVGFDEVKVELEDVFMQVTKGIVS